MFIKCSSFKQAQALIVTLRPLIQCRTIPSLDLRSVESCVNWLLFLYDLKVEQTQFTSILNNSKELDKWLFQNLGLTHAIFSQLSRSGITNKPMVVMKDHLVSIHAYLQPAVPNERTLSSYDAIIKQLQQILNEEEYQRLVQISYLSYPSPYPVIRDVIKRCNQDWVFLFDKDPSGFCNSIRYSTEFIQHNYSFRSFRN